MLAVTVVNDELVALFDVLDGKDQQHIGFNVFKFDVGISSVVEEGLEAEELAGILLKCVTEAVQLYYFLHLIFNLLACFTLHIFESMLVMIMLSVFLIVIVGEYCKRRKSILTSWSSIHVGHSQEFDSFKSNKVCALLHQRLMTLCFSYGFFNDKQVAEFQGLSSKDTATMVLGELDLNTLNIIDNLTFL